MFYNRLELHDKIVKLLTKHREDITLKRDTFTRYDSYGFERNGNKAFMLCESCVILWQDGKHSPAILYLETPKDIVDKMFNDYEKEVWG